MARYKNYCYEQGKMIPISFREEILPGTFESGKIGKPRKSNVTDNDSAKMKTSHGVIQGYDGVAAVDDRHADAGSTGSILQRQDPQA